MTLLKEMMGKKTIQLLNPKTGKSRRHQSMVLLRSQFKQFQYPLDMEAQSQMMLTLVKKKRRVCKPLISEILVPKQLRMHIIKLKKKLKKTLRQMNQLQHLKLNQKRSRTNHQSIKD